MALDKNTLKTSLATLMQRAVDEGWTVEQYATAMSDAIDGYTRGADVVGVRVSGQGHVHDQNNKGKLQ